MATHRSRPALRERRARHPGQATSAWRRPSSRSSWLAQIPIIRWFIPEPCRREWIRSASPKRVKIGDLLPPGSVAVAMPQCPKHAQGSKANALIARVKGRQRPHACPAGSPAAPGNGRRWCSRGRMRISSGGSSRRRRRGENQPLLVSGECLARSRRARQPTRRLCSKAAMPDARKPTSSD
jgi:hypothetical protein